jgi:hypothetical protein
MGLASNQFHFGVLVSSSTLRYFLGVGDGRSNSTSVSFFAHPPPLTFGGLYSVRRSQVPKWAMGRTGRGELNGCIMHQVHTSNILIHLVPSVYDGSFGGWGEGEVSVCLSVTGVLGGGGGRGRWSSGRPPRFPHRPGVQTRTWSPQSIATVQRKRMTVGSHPSPIAPKADIKTFPSPPPSTTKRTDGYIEELSGTKVQNVRIGVLGFLILIG